MTARYYQIPRYVNTHTSSIVPRTSNEMNVYLTSVAAGAEGATTESVRIALPSSSAHASTRWIASTLRGASSGVPKRTVVPPLSRSSSVPSSMRRTRVTRERSIGGMAPSARAAPTGLGGGPSAVVTVLSSIVGSLPPAVEPPRTVPSPAISEPAPPPVTATGVRSVTAISIVRGNDADTSAFAIHGSASSRRRAAPSSNHSTFVSLDTPAVAISSARWRWSAPETSIRRASSSEVRDAKMTPTPNATTTPATTTARLVAPSDRNHSAGREVQIPNDAYLRFEPDARALGDPVLDQRDQRHHVGRGGAVGDHDEVGMLGGDGGEAHA